jgi:hypothetical protein
VPVDRHALHVADADRPAVVDELPPHHGGVGDHVVVLGHQGVDSAECVVPVMVVELSPERVVQQATDRRQLGLPQLRGVRNHHAVPTPTYRSIHRCPSGGAAQRV